jgi:hypothetical protein
MSGIDWPAAGTEFGAAEVFGEMMRRQDSASVNEESIVNTVTNGLESDENGDLIDYTVFDKGGGVGGEKERVCVLAQRGTNDQECLGTADDR